MRFFLILPNKYYTFVTSPFLSASPSPAPFCSIFRGPNRLDLWLDLCLKLLFDCKKNGRWQTVLRVTFGANVWSFVFDFRRPIILLSPRNMPGTHQYAVTLVAQIVAQILGLFWRSLLVDKVSWYMRFFLILPNKYYTFVTSPFLSLSPSPSPFCSIFGSPNRLDLWLNLWRKLWRRFWGCF